MKSGSMVSPECPYPYTPKRIATYQAELAQLPVESACPDCGGTGYVRRGNFAPGHPDFGKIDHCPTCNLERRAAWLASNCGLDPFEQDLSLLSSWKAGDWKGLDSETRQTYRKQRIEAGKAIQEALRARAGLYTFYGDFGSGKTMALQVVANEARIMMLESFYAPFSMLLEHLKSLFKQEAQSSYFWERLLTIPVLCIDEVTRFNETGWAREKLFTLVDTRYRRRASHLTLMATNDDPHTLMSTAEDIGYLFSRMRQGGLIELRGDMREAAK